MNNSQAIVSNIAIEQDRRYWDQAYGGLPVYLELDCHEKIVDWLAQIYDVIGKRVLDIGGGPGIHCKILQEKYLSKCCNIDKSILACEWSRNRAQVFTIMQDLESLPYQLAGGFDFIFSIQVLEHIRKEVIPEIANEIYILLEPGGYLFLSIAPPENTADKDHKTLKSLIWWHDIFFTAGFLHDFERSIVAEKIGIPQGDWNCLFLKKPGKL